MSGSTGIRAPTTYKSDIFIYFFMRIIALIDYEYLPVSRRYCHIILLIFYQKITQQPNICQGSTQGRGNRGGGGEVGATCPHNLGVVGAPPPNFGLSMSFILFLLVFARVLPKK